MAHTVTDGRTRAPALRGGPGTTTPPSGVDEGGGWDRVLPEAVAYGCSAASLRMASVMSASCGTLAISRVSARPMPGDVLAGEQLGRRLQVVEVLLDDAAEQVLAEVRDLGVLVDDQSTRPVFSHALR